MACGPPIDGDSTTTSKDGASTPTTIDGDSVSTSFDGPSMSIITTCEVRVRVKIIMAHMSIR